MLAFLQHAMRNASAPYRVFVERAVIVVGRFRTQIAWAIRLVNPSREVG